MTIKDWLKNFYEDLTESELQEAEYRIVEFYAFLAKKLSENWEILQQKN